MFMITFKTICHPDANPYCSLTRLNTVVRLAFLSAASKVVFIFVQELLDKRTTILRMIWSSGDVVGLGRPDSSFAVNIPSFSCITMVLYTAVLLLFSFGWVIYCKATIRSTKSKCVWWRPYHTANSCEFD